MDQQCGEIQPVTLFYSYAHKDEELRDELEKHLSLLRRQGFLSTWSDRQIVPGTDWSQEIDEHLQSARIILLLISSDFLNSDYCYGIEMLCAIERYNLGEATVIPIILRPVDWQGAPFAHLQCLPRDGKAVTEWENRDIAFRNIAKGIRAAIEKMSSFNSIKFLSAKPIQNDLKIRATTNADGSISITYEFGEAKVFTSQIFSHDVEQVLPLMSRDFPRIHYRFGEEATLHIRDIARRVSTFLLPPPINKQLHEKQIRSIQILIDQTDPPLPWELLYDGEEFIGLEIPIVNTPLERARERVDLHPKSLLVIESLPVGFGLQFDSIQASYMRYIQDLEGLTSISRIQVENVAQLAAMIHSQEFDIIHFAAHTIVDSGDVYFLLGNAPISAKQLSEVFGKKREPKLIILDSCESALSLPYLRPTFEHNAAYILSQLGWYVIGITGWLTDSTSIAFNKAFYKYLTHNQSIEEAVCEARRYLYDLGENWWGFTLFKPGS